MERAQHTWYKKIDMPQNKKLTTIGDDFYTHFILCTAAFFVFLSQPTWGEQASKAEYI